MKKIVGGLENLTVQSKTDLAKNRYLKYKLLFLLFSSFFYVKGQQKTLVKADSLIAINNNEAAVDLLLKEYDSLEGINDTLSSILYAEKIGRVFSSNLDYKNARKYFFKLLHFSEAKADTVHLRMAHYLLGNTYLKKYNEKDDWGDSIDNFLVAEAKGHYDIVIDKYASYGHGKRLMANLYSNYSVLKSHRGELDDAETYARKALEINMTLFDTLDIIGDRNNLSLVKLYKKDYTGAIHLLNENLQSVKILDSTDAQVLSVKASIYGNLSYAYKMLGDYEKAYSFNKKSVEISNAYRDQQQLEALNEIEAKYNADKVRQEEQLNTAREATKKATFQKWTLVLGIALLGLILTLYLVGRAAKLKRRNLQLSLIQQEYEKEQQISRLQADNQDKVLSATLDGREIERKEIAHTLHDNVSSLLSSANLHLQVTKHKAGTGIEELDKAKLIIQEASEKIRDLSHELVSSVLLKFGLAKSLQDTCEKYSNTEIRFNCEVDRELPRYDEDFEIKVNNMVVECLNNILKHSEASQAHVVIRQQAGQLLIDIEDNGRGLDTATTALHHKGGIGLGQIKARVKALGGKFAITSQIDEGVKVSFKIPVKPR